MKLIDTRIRKIEGSNENVDKRMKYTFILFEALILSVVIYLISAGVITLTLLRSTEFRPQSLLMYGHAMLPSFIIYFFAEKYVGLKLRESR